MEGKSDIHYRHPRVPDPHEVQLSRIADALERLSRIADSIERLCALIASRVVNNSSIPFSP